MKTFIICAFLLSALSAVVVSSSDEDIKEIAKACNIKDSRMADIFSGGIKPEDVTNDDKCALKCLLEKVASMKLKAEGAKQVSEDVLKKCLAVKGDNPCDTAYKIVMCLKDNAAF